MPDLLDLEQLLNGSVTIKEALGEDLQHGITKFMAQCHPDRHPDNQAEAKGLFMKASAISQAIFNPQVIPSQKRTYNLHGVFAVGDVSDIYFSNGADKEASAYVVKVSRTEGAFNLLESERKALMALHTAAEDSSYRLYFPLLAESFPVQDRIQKRVNVFTAVDGYHPLPFILKRHTELSGRHIAWLFKRVLTGLGFAHNQGLIHGAVLPEHILVNASTHGIMLCGWGQSVEEHQRVMFISRENKGYYPLEILSKKPATSESDIYMAAMCMCRSMSVDDMDPKIVAFVNSCTVERQMMRPDDAWELADEFADLLGTVYGPPRFVPLTM